MNILHVLSAFFFLILNSTISYSQNFQTVPLFIKANADNVGLDEGEEIYRVRNNWLNKLQNGTYDNIQILVPTINGSILLQATKRQIVPNEGIKVTTQSGQYFYNDAGVHYFGSIDGQQYSSVIISVIEDQLHILIQNKQKEVKVIKNHPDIANRYLSKLTEEFDSVIDCGSGITTNGIKNIVPSQNRNSGDCNLICDSQCTGTTDVHVFYEFDFLSFLDEGSDINNCINFITMTHAVINHIYSNIDEVQNNQHQGQNNQAGHPTLSSDINMILSSFHIWDHPDPYPINLFDRLDAFQTQRPVFDGDVAHLISKGIINAGGVSSIDTSDTSASLCNNNIAPAGVTPHSLSFLTATPLNFANTFSFGTALIAHELGHTLGGRHPNECKWYGNNSFSVHRDASTCELLSNCVDPTCTITSGYAPTIMSRCWFTNSPDSTIDYSNPFHREIALNILDNLCNIDLCYNPCESDLDLDGYCDEEDCNDSDPTLPGIAGASCSDDNFLTVNDTIVGMPGDTSCLCEGTLWTNAGTGNLCNLIVGGQMDFEEDMVGGAEATWYGGLQTGWTTSPGNTPDIAHAIVGGVCEQFIGFAGQWINNAIGIKEGIAIALSDPVPCSVGQVHLSFEYSIVNRDTTNTNFTTDLINIQGSEVLDHTMNHDCIEPGIICLGTAAPPDLMCTTNNFTGLFQDPCDVNLNFCNQAAMTLVNNASFDLNFLYISFNVNDTFPDGIHEIFIDNISVAMLPESYSDISATTDSCDIATITYSKYCSYELQRFDGLNWQSIPNSEYEIVSSIESISIGNHKVVTDSINYAVFDCADYRVVQFCPPSDSVINSCAGGPVFDIDLSNCNNDITLNLITAPVQDTFCTGDQVIIFNDPNLTGFNSVWSSPLWASDTMTSSVQINLKDDLLVTTPGAHEFSVAVIDSVGCVGMDTISLIYEECPLSFCDRNDINVIIDLEIDSSLSFWLDSIPHTMNNTTGLVTIRSQNIAVSTNSPENLVCDVDVLFILCDILFERNSGIETNNSLTLTASNLIPCAPDDRWRNLKINQDATLRTLAGTQIIRTSGIIAEAANDLNIFQSYIELTGIGTGIFIKDVVNFWDISSTEITQTSIGIHIDNSRGLIHDCDINEFRRNGIRLINNSDGIVISNNHFSESANFNVHIDESAILSRRSFPFVLGNNVNSNHGVKLDNNTLSVIENNVITTERTSLQSFRTNSRVENNFLTTNGTGSIFTTLNFTPVVTLNASTTTTMFNNVITRDGLGSGVLSQGSTGFLTMINNDITAGGNFGFFSLSAISNNGTQSNRTHIEGNVINCIDAPGISNLNSAGTDMICNDIISVNGPFGGSFNTSGIWNDIDSDNAYLESNTLESPLDLYTASTIRDQFHTGNCFNGDRVEANGFSFQDVQDLGMIFDVNGNDNACYFESNHSPQGWFDNNPGQALTCDGLPGTEIGDPTDTTRVCRYLEFLDNQLQDSTRTDLTIMRLISLFRMYNDTTLIDEDTDIPSCLTTYLDTTSICGIKMLLTMDSLVTTATIGSDTIRLRIQVQSTITYLALVQWQNASEADKDSLRLLYLQELDKLREIINMKRTEEEVIWSTIDSLQIAECLDSISMIEMIAYKYMARDSLTQPDKQVIDQYARWCAKEYGRGILL